MRYVFLSIALSLMLLGNTSLWPTLLRGEATFLKLPNSTVLITFGPIYLNYKSHIASTEPF